MSQRNMGRLTEGSMGWHGRSKGMDGHLCVRGVHCLLLHVPLSFSEHSSRTERTLAVEVIAIQETVRSDSRVNHVSNAGFSLRLRDEAAQDDADRLQGALVPPRTMGKLAASSRLLPVHDSVASALCSPPREDRTPEDPVNGICFDAILVPPMWFRRTNYRLQRGAGLDRRRPGKTELPAAAVPWRRVGLHDGLTCTPPDYTTSLAKL
ncbi:hypothetical protein CTAM01_05197 [Colletotrichum tamarilloi]|uniref:Uncharacterized protein n=1 Tax=Colletotrichum tamarilloi TaxID=1209934 RepID=A0ABQ9RF34_9PEZI|nr:uncharacterized protein CTAM01_05197 [Colletotrichum tamarilloi]KAK1502384.1 hypothetical protein CTAM01_05197 [Colletotrichum tamarilloi]